MILWSGFAVTFMQGPALFGAVFCIHYVIGGSSPSVDPGRKRISFSKTFPKWIDFLRSTDDVRNMDSMINSDQIKDVRALQENAKRFYTTLLNEGKWKKPKTVQNQSAFSGQSNSQNAKANAKGKEWKFNKSLGNNNKLTFDGREYKWCNGPGHGNRGMWVKHAPGTCTNNGSSMNNNGSNNSSPSSVNNANACTNIKKTTFQKKVANLLKDAAEGDTESVVAAIKKSGYLMCKILIFWC